MENEIRYFSMFTGVGGFEIGLERASNSPNDNRGDRTSGKFERISEQSKESGSSDTRKFKCVGFSEIDKFANELLANKFPNVKNYGDATKIDPNELPEFDMLCGGFPCQSFSLAGKRRGFEDTRGTMFFEVARILEVKRPKIVFLENVKGLLNHEKGKTFVTILQTLSELGYDVQWLVLNSKFFGVPQNRERVFIIGHLRGEPRPEILPFRQTSEEVDRVDGQEDKVEITNRGPREVGWKDVSPALLSRDYKDPKAVKLNNLGMNGRRIKESGEESFTLASGQGCENAVSLNDNKIIRKLTPLECERLQGFHDNWTEGFSSTQRYKQMGNAVTTNVIQAIGEKL